MSSRVAAIETMLRSPSIWRGGDIAPMRARPTGFGALDRLLPGYGWPLSALIELLPTHEGIGELSLLMPVLRQLCSEGRDIAFIRPPHVPYPPALARAGLPLNRIVWIDTQSDEDACWAAVQTLNEGLTGAVLLWSHTQHEQILRRLQLAAREADSLTFVYRPREVLARSSPASIRMTLQAAEQGVQVQVHKAQGGRLGAVTLPMHDVA